MLNQSTVLAHRRICILLGGPREPAPRIAPRVAALLRPARRQPA